MDEAKVIQRSLSIKSDTAISEQSTLRDREMTFHGFRSSCVDFCWKRLSLARTMKIPSCKTSLLTLDYVFQTHQSALQCDLAFDGESISTWTVTAASCCDCQQFLVVFGITAYCAHRIENSCQIKGVV